MQIVTDQIKTFGSIGYIKIPKPESKFDIRAIKAVLVGYKPTSFVLWHPNTRKFFESRHVRFNEKLVYKDVYKNNNLEENKIRTPGEKRKEIDWNWLRDIKENETEEKREEIAQ